MAKQNAKVVIRILVDSEFKKRLRLYAAKNDTTMTDVVREALEHTLKSDEK